MHIFPRAYCSVIIIVIFLKCAHVLSFVLRCADAESESGRLRPVEELRRVSGSRRRPLWLVYSGEQVRMLLSLSMSPPDFSFFFCLRLPAVDITQSHPRILVSHTCHMLSNVISKDGCNVRMYCLCLSKSPSAIVLYE